MNKLQLGLSLLPLAAVAIGILTYVIALRADLTGAISDVEALQAAQGEQMVVGERLAGLEASLMAMPDASLWQEDIGQRVVALESTQVEGYDDTELVAQQRDVGQRVVALESTQVEGYDDAELVAQLQNLALQSADASTRLDYVESEYGPAIETLREGTGLDERLAELAREVSSNATQLDGLDLSNYGDISGRLSAMEIIVSTISADGEVDLSPLVVRLAELEGRVESVSDISAQVRALQTDVASLKGMPAADYDDSAIRADITSLQNTVRTLRVSSGGGAAYDDAAIRRSISSIQSDVSSLESSLRSLQTSSGGGAAYDDSSLRSSLGTVESDLATLEATVTGLPTSSGTSYDDSSLRSSLGTVESDLATLGATVQGLSTSSGAAYDDSALQSLVSNLSASIATLQSTVSQLPGQVDYSSDIDTLMNKVNDLDWWLGSLNDEVVGMSTGGDQSQEIADIRGELESLNEALGQTFEAIFNEMDDLWDDLDFLASDASSGASGGSANVSGVPEELYIQHSTNPNQYDGTYVRAGDYNGFPVWECYECNGTSGQFAISYLFRYPVAFTVSGWVWAIQPIPPSTEWSANSYLDAEWPWEGTNWSGDVQSVTVVG